MVARGGTAPTPGTMRTSLMFLSLSVSLALGCDAGSVNGPGGADDTPDAAPINPEIQCTTRYEATGNLQHDVPPVEGASCDPTGTWTIEISGPKAGAERPVCSQAPGTASFTLVVTAGSGERDHEVADQDDPSRTWDGRFADKGGSCSGSFEATLPGGIEWSLHPAENGPDGPFEGSARFEIVE